MAFVVEGVSHLSMLALIRCIVDVNIINPMHDYMVRCIIHK